MDQLCGKKGEVVRFDGDGDVWVKFKSIRRSAKLLHRARPDYCLNPDCLTLIDQAGGPKQDAEEGLQLSGLMEDGWKGTEEEATTESADATNTSVPGEIARGACSRNEPLRASYAPMRTAHAGIIEKAAGQTPR